MAALTYVLPQGQPLIYTGQEIGHNDRFEFFEKDPVKAWEANEWTTFYKSLNAMRHTNPALRNGGRGGDMVYVECANADVLAFSREVEGNKVVAMFNLSAAEQNVAFEVAFEGYVDALTGEAVALAKEFTMAPWEFRILVKK